MRYFFVLSWMTLGLLGCRSHITENSSTSGVAIINGAAAEPKDAVSRTVVRIISGVTEENHVEHFFSCTGTLVEKRFVLTAAHCLIGAGGKPQSDVKIRFGEETVAAESFVFHPLYDKVSGGLYDIGLIRLAQDAPPQFESAFISPQFRDLSTEKLFAAGFGKTESGDQQGLRWAPVRLLTEATAGLHPEALWMLDGAALGTKDARMLPIDQFRSTDGGICFGDSGGPLFYFQKEKIYLVGVNVVVYDDRCTEGYSGATSVFYMRQWLAQAFAALKKTPGAGAPIDALIPAWTQMTKLPTDSENIETPIGVRSLPTELLLGGLKINFQKIRLVHAQRNDIKVYSTDVDELQLFADSNLTCESLPLRSTSAPNVSIPLFRHKDKPMFEKEGAFIAYKKSAFVHAVPRFFISELTDTYVQFNIIDENNKVITIRSAYLHCY